MKEGIAYIKPDITNTLEYIDTFNLSKNFKVPIFYFKDYGCSYLLTFCLMLRRYIIGMSKKKVKLILLSPLNKYRRSFAKYPESGELPDECVKDKPTNNFWNNLIERIDLNSFYIIVDKTRYSNVLISGNSVHFYYGIGSSLDIEEYNLPIEHCFRAGQYSSECSVKDLEELGAILKARYIITYIDNFSNQNDALKYSLYIKYMKHIFLDFLNLIKTV